MKWQFKKETGRRSCGTGMILMIQQAPNVVHVSQGIVNSALIAIDVRKPDLGFHEQNLPSGILMAVFSDDVGLRGLGGIGIGDCAPVIVERL
jgi:hypothetical protein